MNIMWQNLRDVKSQEQLNGETISRNWHKGEPGWCLVYITPVVIFVTLLSSWFKRFHRFFWKPIRKNCVVLGEFANTYSSALSSYDLTLRNSYLKNKNIRSLKSKHLLAVYLAKYILSHIMKKKRLNALKPEEIVYNKSLRATYYPNIN